jgi:uncharacterized membrane protein
VWTRTVCDAPRNADGSFTLSLDGARHLPAEDRAALEWLQRHARGGESVLEAVGRAPDGNIGGDFSEFGRVSALTGVATPLGWPQHVLSWGADWAKINERWQTVQRIYAWPDKGTTLADLQNLDVRYIFVGDVERRTYDPGGLARLHAALPIVYENRDTFIAAVPR